MHYRKLGNSGVSVSTLALGTMGFGKETPEPEAFAIIDAFLEAGGNMLDTADVYGGGASEELLGRWRDSRPADLTGRVVLATKGRFGTGPDVNALQLAVLSLEGGTGMDRAGQARRSACTATRGKRRHR